MEVVWHVTNQEEERKLTVAAELSEEEIKLAEIEINNRIKMSGKHTAVSPVACSSARYRFHRS